MDCVGTRIQQGQLLLIRIILQEAKNVVAITAVNFHFTLAIDCNCNTVVNCVTIFRVQHVHRAFGGGALLEQVIGACGQSRGGKGEHHASGQRHRYCTPDKFALFHGTTSFFPLAFLRGGGMYYSTLIIPHFTAFWKQTCVNRDLNA